jgi:hypothetical protein
MKSDQADNVNLQAGPRKGRKIFHATGRYLLVFALGLMVSTVAHKVQNERAVRQVNAMVADIEKNTREIRKQYNENAQQTRRTLPGIAL